MNTNIEAPYKEISLSGESVGIITALLFASDIFTPAMMPVWVWMNDYEHDAIVPIVSSNPAGPPHPPWEPGAHEKVSLDNCDFATGRSYTAEECCVLAETLARADAYSLLLAVSADRLYRRALNHDGLTHDDGIDDALPDDGDYDGFLAHPENYDKFLARWNRCRADVVTEPLLSIEQLRDYCGLLNAIAYGWSEAARTGGFTASDSDRSRSTRA